MQATTGEFIAAVVVGLVFLVRLGRALYLARGDGRIAARRKATTR